MRGVCRFIAGEFKESNVEDTELCSRVAAAIGAIWARTDSQGTPYAARFARLASIVAHQNQGKQGAGLSGGQQQETLFRDMLIASDSRFSETSDRPSLDADYYFDSHPLSHKTIGFKGSGDLALSWSKNGPEGILRDRFDSSMVIMCFRDPAASGPLKSLPQGAYVIPATYLRGNVTLGANNKTDSLISKKDVAQAMRYAMAQHLYVPLRYQHAEGRGVRISVWVAGNPPAVPPL